MDFALDVDTGRMILPPRPIRGAARIAQSIRIALRTWLADWFLDTTQGVPFLEQILARKAKPETIEAILRGQILLVNGVLSIQSFTMDINNRTRVCTIKFVANSAEGLVEDAVTIRG
jgi:hypothetical protein